MTLICMRWKPPRQSLTFCQDNREICHREDLDKDEKTVTKIIIESEIYIIIYI